MPFLRISCSLNALGTVLPCPPLVLAPWQYLHHCNRFPKSETVFHLGVLAWICVNYVSCVTRFFAYTSSWHCSNNSFFFSSLKMVICFLAKSFQSSAHTKTHAEYSPVQSPTPPFHEYNRRSIHRSFCDRKNVCSCSSRCNTVFPRNRHNKATLKTYWQCRF